MTIPRGWTVRRQPSGAVEAWLLDDEKRRHVLIIGALLVLQLVSLAAFAWLLAQFEERGVLLCLGPGVLLLGVIVATRDGLRLALLAAGDERWIMSPNRLVVHRSLGPVQRRHEFVDAELRLGRASWTFDAYRRQHVDQIYRLQVKQGRRTLTLTSPYMRLTNAPFDEEQLLDIARLLRETTGWEWAIQ